MAFKEAFDARNGDNERARKLNKGRCAHDEKQGHLVPNDRLKFVRFVTNAAIVRERDPAVPADLREPSLIRRLWLEMVGVALDRKTAGPECFRELSA